MMKERIYRIAGHVVLLRFADSHDAPALLPSYEPFALERIPDGEEPVLSVDIDDAWEFHPVGVEIGRFDCGGNMYDVAQLPGGDYQFVVHAGDGEVCCIMQSDCSFHHCHVAVKATGKGLRSFGLNSCLMIAYAFSTVHKQTLLVHASVIRREGRGYLMTAPSGTGKSTHTYLWYKNLPGCDLMNDDNPVVRIVDGHSVVYGSPWSGKTPCYRKVEAPIGAIVRIQQRKQNEIRPMGTAESLAVMLSQVSSMKWDRDIYHAVCATLGKLFACTPMFELGCLPNAEAARLCYETVSKAHV